MLCRASLRVRQLNRLRPTPRCHVLTSCGEDLLRRLRGVKRGWERQTEIEEIQIRCMPGLYGCDRRSSGLNINVGKIRDHAIVCHNPGVFERLRDLQEFVGSCE